MAEPKAIEDLYEVPDDPLTPVRAGDRVAGGDDMSTKDVQTRFHEEWLGLAQPIEGLVFSVPVLADAQITPTSGPELTARFKAELVHVPDPAGKRQTGGAGSAGVVAGCEGDVREVPRVRRGGCWSRGSKRCEGAALLCGGGAAGCAAKLCGGAGAVRGWGGRSEQGFRATPETPAQAAEGEAGAEERTRATSRSCGTCEMTRGDRRGVVVGQARGRDGELEVPAHGESSSGC